MNEVSDMWVLVIHRVRGGVSSLEWVKIPLGTLFVFGEAEEA